MRRFRILPVFAAPLLAGCLLSNEEVDRRFTLAARWLPGDSTFVFSLHDEVPFEGMPRGRMANVRLFQAKVDDSGQLREYGEVYEISGAWGCSDLRVSDSLIVTSYYRYPEEDGSDQEGCPNTRHGLKAFAARVGDTIATLTAEPDSVGQHLMFTVDDDLTTFDAGFERRGNPRNGRDICLVNGPCLKDLVRDWDAGK